MEVLEKIKNGVIISCQAMKSEPLYEEIAMQALITEVLRANPDGLRLAGVRDIKFVKENFPQIPVIGITKPDIIPENYKELVYITPEIEDVDALANAGADIIAFDGTKRDRKTSVLELINKIHEYKKLAMADISTLEEGIEAEKLGADIVSTTLSGYVSGQDKNMEIPDFELLQELIGNIKIPVILEGRIWEPTDIKKAFEIGAYATVIGSAVTRPKDIVNRFIRKGKEWKKLWQLT